MARFEVTVSDASGGAKNSATLPLDFNSSAEVALQADVTGTATYTIQQTLDNVFDSTVTPVWFDHPDTNLVGATADKQGNYAYCPAAVRVRQTAGSGSVKLTALQARK